MIDIKSIIQKRILVLDGAMGTMVQQYNLEENDFRGSLFANAPISLKGNNDLLSLTRPDIITEIHQAYLDAGADIIETNTFNANIISLSDYYYDGINLEKLSYKLNYEAAQLAKKSCAPYQTNDKPRFVAGSIGPTNKTASVSPDVNNPAQRSVSYDELVHAYYIQAKGLWEGGVDIFLVETIFDTLNAKAALFALQQLMEDNAFSLHIIVSATIADLQGRTFTGQTIEALYASLSHIDLLAFGFNCGYGPQQLIPFIKKLDNISGFPISLYANAGLPDAMGNYTQTAAIMGGLLKNIIDNKLVNIIGGCCGTTPAHIKQIAQLVETAHPRPIPHKNKQGRLAGLKAINLDKAQAFIKIGERTNVAGSKVFENLIREKDYEKAIHIARKQIEAGADIIDVCMDAPLINAQQSMIDFLNLLASEPHISKVPIMLDSSDFNVIEAGLKCIQGKPIVNSISLKDGHKTFLDKATTIRKYGAALVLMLFDEKGQADTLERRIEIAQKAIKLLKTINFPEEDIVIDPNVLTIGTGMPEHANYALDFINFCKWSKKQWPHIKISGGISNISFSFRGNDYLRQAIHTVFLHHSINAGLNMGIVNPNHNFSYDVLNLTLREYIENLIFNKSNNATEELVTYISTNAPLNDNVKNKQTQKTKKTAKESIIDALLNGNNEQLLNDVNICVADFSNPLDFIEDVLMVGMNEVGQAFGKGDMFLPQVIKSARIMKQAVDIIQPRLDALKIKSATKPKEKILIATVKGDVHDIGKNIVKLVLSCNGYHIVDLGVMVPSEEITNVALKEKVDIIALSGLITPSLAEMIEIAKAMESHHLEIPLLIGGATTSESHTALHISTHYKGPVIHVKDASSCVQIVNNLTKINNRDSFIKQNTEKQKLIRTNFSGEATSLISLDAARQNKCPYTVASILYNTKALGVTDYLDFSVQQLIYYLDWNAFIQSWQLQKSTHKAQEELLADAKKMLCSLCKENKLIANASVGIYAAQSKDEDIIIFQPNDNKPLTHIPFLRNQKQQNNKNNYCLADFITPESTKNKDILGMFVLSIELKKTVVYEENSYESLLSQILTNHLADAFSEYLHELTTKRVIKQNSLTETQIPSGIRPAIGYPSCPDHSLKEIVFEQLNVTKKWAITLTESYAMKPLAAVCGFYLFNPHAAYYPVGKIDQAQFEDYKKRRQIPTEILNKTLIKNLDKN